jgi:hypothetical protein
MGNSLINITFRSNLEMLFSLYLKVLEGEKNLIEREKI